MTTFDDGYEAAVLAELEGLLQRAQELVAALNGKRETEQVAASEVDDALDGWTVTETAETFEARHRDGLRSHAVKAFTTRDQFITRLNDLVAS